MKLCQYTYSVFENGGQAGPIFKNIGRINFFALRHDLPPLPIFHLYLPSTSTYLPPLPIYYFFSSCFVTKILSTHTPLRRYVIIERVAVYFLIIQKFCLNFSIMCICPV